MFPKSGTSGTANTRPDPSDGRNRKPVEDGCRHFVRRDKPRIVRDKRYRARSRAGRKYALHGQQRSAWIYRSAGNHHASVRALILQHSSWAACRRAVMLALIQIDGQLSDDVLDQLCSLPDVVQAKAIVILSVACRGNALFRLPNDAKVVTKAALRDCGP